ncbi:MAG: 3-phosphoshikimate 1-carboxyvinyltransferase [Parachlamydiales bacterium]|nr:3-phosphoshikimate 1-carboxyvinyltransferase [Parachlamydiales bacterium]
MVCLKVSPSCLKGSLMIPPSKSHTMRAIIFGCMGEGRTTIDNYLQSPDVLAMVEAFRLLGITIEIVEQSLVIHGMNGQLQPTKEVIHAKNSGQVLRFIGSLAALLPTYTVITGDHSLCYNRPVQPLLSGLTQLLAFATSCYGDDKAPIIIKGPIVPGSATIRGEDSQPVSGLLIACSFLEGITTLKVENPGEKPWIDLTLFWLKKFGGKITHDNYTFYKIEGPLHYPGFSMKIPGDFSSAAFPIAAALVTGSTITLENLDFDDIQGDKKILDLLQKMNASYKANQSEKTLTIVGGDLEGGITIDINDIIDALPILAVLGCFAKKPIHIVNGAIARKKESDRIHTIATELRKMGAHLEEHRDGLLVFPSHLHGVKVDSHKDHRIAMALAIAALGAKGNTVIQNIECISKSYKTFVEDFQKIGAQMELLNE